jgi:hypothetical protein
MFLVLCCVNILLSGCHSLSDKGVQGDVHIANFDNIGLKQEFIYSSLFDSVKIIPLSDKGPILSRVAKMETFHSNFVILDSEQAKGVYLFDQDGNYLYRYGNVGFGPEDYQSCEDFAIDEDKSMIYIYDRISEKLIAYNLKNGDYIKTIKLKNVKIDRIRIIDGKLYGVLTKHSPLWSGEDNPYILKEISLKDGTVLNQWLKMNDFNKGWGGVLNETSLFYKINNGKELFSYGISDTIICFDKGKIYPYMLLEGSRTVNIDDFSEKEKNISEIKDAMERTMIELQMQSRLGREKGKILSTMNFFLRGTKLYFQCRSHSLSQSVYDIENGSLEVFNSRNDDIFFKERPSSMIYPQFKGNDEKGVYYMYGSDMLYQLTFFYEKDLLSDKVKNKELLKHLNEDSNPVILYYEFK